MVDRDEADNSAIHDADYARMQIHTVDGERSGSFVPRIQCFMSCWQKSGAFLKYGR